MPNRKKQGQNVSEQRIASWDDAIADAKRRLKDIEFALQVFEERKKNGEPWPGNEGLGDAAAS